MGGRPGKAVVLISNDLSHPALRDQQYAFSWRINRLRPLLKRGYTLIVVAAGGRTGPHGRPKLSGLIPRITNDGNLVVIAPPILRIPMLWLLQSMIFTPLMVSLYCRSHRIKVEAIVGASVPYGAVGKVLNRVLRTTLIVDYGDPDYAREKGVSLRVLRLLESYVLGSKGVDAVTCIDPNIRRYVRRYGREALFLPPGGFWAGERRSAPAGEGKDSGRVIYAGHVAGPPAYRLDLLVEACPGVLAKNPGSSFVILGEGEYLHELRAKVKMLGLEGRVQASGAVAYSEARSQIRDSEVAVQVLNDMCLGTKVL
ncbi:MAG: hypothetical protein OK454_12375, partial [Thaumarchaeota archaeon]|nr:hypothetical protein [Nitrososphaerota archaeon]